MESETRWRNWVTRSLKVIQVTRVDQVPMTSYGRSIAIIEAYLVPFPTYSEIFAENCDFFLNPRLLRFPLKYVNGALAQLRKLE